jgi:3-hydroxyisobutyrate dehydrogenase-like beta-hydroxyacid dehydrogenase
MTTFRSIGVVSTGEMGLGIAKLLVAHGYEVFTYAEDRSQNTRDNATSAGVHLAKSIVELTDSIDALLSIVPPRDALATAKRFADAVSESGRGRPLYYLDLNATSPSTAKRTARLFSKFEQIKLIDGGIIGGVPHPLPASSTQAQPNGSSQDAAKGSRPHWHCPRLLVSGPDQLPDPQLSQTLNIDHLSDEIGAATCVKMCFAATTKGFISLAIESYTTAHQLGVLDSLRSYLSRYHPATHTLAEKGLVTMPPKAYRWVGEMKEIGQTFEDGGCFKADL